ncbi:uncharacterized protein LOC124253652 [Haliotis rubra]|uniref:uncharacterized protein LOC124253652 n=1 Tax=Haliotis rubra TaxID=36100 RepID=UPI001EE5F9CF|nr:uncharacterized protein LOC124253652 [Haliotis rubra]
MVLPVQKKYVLVAVTVPIFVACVLLYNTDHFTLVPLLTNSGDILVGPCPSVLDNMMIGAWSTRTLTPTEQKEIDAFLMNGLFFIDPRHGVQKPDGTCGNVTYYPWMSKEPNSRWFRVLCDPKGPSPCCYKNMCQAKTTVECRCDECFDLRQQIHAEYSLWRPLDPRCNIKTFTSMSACELLQGGTVHLYGDSLVRQLFLALVIILKNDFETGGLLPNAPQAVKDSCRGMYVFPTKNCREYLDYNPYVCGGSVQLKFHHAAHSPDIQSMLKVASPLAGVNRSIILFGCGVWQHFDIQETTKFALTLTNMFRLLSSKSEWPKLVWAGFHYLGLWRHALVPTVNNAYVAYFNQYMKQILAPLKVSMFDTVNITKGVRSVDGTHYGPGINFLKAQIYLNYIEELQRKGDW